MHAAARQIRTAGGGATFRISFPLASRPEAAEHLNIETQPLQRLTQADIDEMSAELGES